MPVRPQQQTISSYASGQQCDRRNGRMPDSARRTQLSRRCSDADLNLGEEGANGTLNVDLRPGVHRRRGAGHPGRNSSCSAKPLLPRRLRFRRGTATQTGTVRSSTPPVPSGVQPCRELQFEYDHGGRPPLSCGESCPGSANCVRSSGKVPTYSRRFKDLPLHGLQAEAVTSTPPSARNQPARPAPAHQRLNVFSMATR